MSSEKFGIRIKSFRAKNNIKQGEFARKIGVSQGSLSEIESGKTKPSADTISSICRNYPEEMTWFLTGFPAEEIERVLLVQLKHLKKTIVRTSAPEPPNSESISQSSIYNKVVKQVDGMVDLNYDVKQLIMQLCRVYYLSDDIGRAKLGVLLAALDPGGNK